jgi:hypothetical protein
MAEVMSPDARRARLQRRLTTTKNRLEEARASQAAGDIDRSVADLIRALEFLVDVLDDELVNTQ